MKFGFISFLKEERRKEIEKIFIRWYFISGKEEEMLILLCIFPIFIINFLIHIFIWENSNFYGSLVLFFFFLITLMKFIRYEDKIRTETGNKERDINKW